MGYHARLRHVELDIRRFVERELLGFLEESTAFADVAVDLGRTEVGTNSLLVEIKAPQFGDEPLWISFEEQSGRLIASLSQAGWTRHVTVPQRAVLAGLLVGFYRISGVDLVRGQIAACLGEGVSPYEITDAGLDLLPKAAGDAEVIYDLDEFPEIVPRIEGALIAANHRPVNAKSLVFADTRTLWTDWVDAWSREDAGEPFPELLPPEAHPGSFHSGRLGPCNSAGLANCEACAAPHIFSIGNSEWTRPSLPIVRKEPIVPDAHPAPVLLKIGRTQGCVVGIGA